MNLAKWILIPQHNKCGKQPQCISYPICSSRILMPPYQTAEAMLFLLETGQDFVTTLNINNRAQVKWGSVISKSV